MAPMTEFELVRDMGEHSLRPALRAVCEYFRSIKFEDAARELELRMDELNDEAEAFFADL